MQVPAVLRTRSVHCAGGHGTGFGTAKAYLVTVSVGPHEPEHREAGLCPAVYKADHLNRWHTVNDDPRQDILQLTRRAI